MTAVEFDRLDHVGAGVRDLDEAIAWWRGNFGFVFETAFDIAETGARGAFIRRGGVRLELFEHPQRDKDRAWRRDPMEALRTGGLHHVAFSVDDVGAAFEELASRGVDVAWPTADGPFGRYAIVSDPSGNHIELFPKTDIRDPATGGR